MSKMDLFIGLCVLESEQMALDVAGAVQEALTPYQSQLNLYFKGSFDKANRTSIKSFRGPGLEQGLKILEKVKAQTGLPTLTDFHLPSQADEVASVVTVLQVPAFLCRQTDMIVAGAEAVKKYGGKLNVKKGQFLSPHDAQNIVEKCSEFLDKKDIYLTERGSSFGYNNLIVDMASFSVMKQFGCQTIHDATHCVQKPGGLGHQTGGKREQIPVLAKAAIAAGADGLFMETHPEPEKALSDSATAYPLKDVASFISTLLKIRQAIQL